MKSIKHNKLVRDKIPDIILNKGDECKTEILSDEDYIKMLDLKLAEELEEYQIDKSIEELADLLEVIYATASARGYSSMQLEKIRQDKRKKNGDFTKKILLREVIKK